MDHENSKNEALEMIPNTFSTTGFKKLKTESNEANYGRAMSSSGLQTSIDLDDLFFY